MFGFKRNKYVTMSKFEEVMLFETILSVKLENKLNDLQRQVDELKRLVPVHATTDFGAIIQNANREVVKPKRKYTKKK